MSTTLGIVIICLLRLGAVFTNRLLQSFNETNLFLFNETSVLI